MYFLSFCGIFKSKQKISGFPPVPGTPQPLYYAGFPEEGLTLKNNKNDKNNQRRTIIGIATILVWALVLLGAVYAVSGSMSDTGSVEIQFSELISLVKSDQVESVTMESGKYTVTLTEEAEQARLESY